MANWLHRLFNPHCLHCREEQLERQDRADRVRFEPIEVLRHELDLANVERQQMTALIIKLSGNKVEDSPVPPANKEPGVIRPRSVPWSVKQQLLEREDRAKALSLRRAAQPDTPKPVAGQTTEELEESLSVTLPEEKSDAI